MEIRDDGLFEKTSANEMLTRWGAIHAIQCGRSTIYVEVAPGVFHIIPRKAFPDEAAYREYWKELESRWKRDA
jgi:YcxB-like protein